MQNDEKKDFFTNYLSGEFCTAVRDYCCMSDVMSRIIIGSLIGEYVREDPNKDIAQHTKDLLFALKKFTPINAAMIDVPEWKDRLTEIKNSFFSSLDEQVLGAYKNELEGFFEKLAHYGEERLAKTKSSARSMI